MALYAVDSEYFENDDPVKTKLNGDNKNRGLWPLPGGTTAYVDTLFDFLAAVNAGINTKSKLTEWFLKNYDSVKSRKTTIGYINVPRTMGLVDISNGKIILTEAGVKVAAEHDLKFLYETFAQNVFGINEIVEFLVELSGSSLRPAGRGFARQAGLSLVVNGFRG